MFAAMKGASSFRPQDIRNIALIGTNGSGKTTLAEALLLRCGVITRMGTIESGSTTGDFEPEARSHGFSTSSSLLFATHEGREINVIDTPGHPEFVGHALAALPAVETAVVVVNAQFGVDFATRRLFHAAGEAGLARMVVVNKIDQNLAGLEALVDQLRAELGNSLHPINLPTKGGTDVIDCFDQETGEADFGSVADVHREMLESSIEIDDAEVEKYFAGETIDLAELRTCFVKAMAVGHVVPVLFTAATSQVGVDDLLHILVEEGPSPLDAKPKRLKSGDELVEITCDVEKPLLAHVFKVANDPYSGKLAMLRILQGQLDGSTPFVAAADKKPRKAGQVLKIEGRDHPEVDGVAYAGDLVAVARIDELHVDQILHAPTVTEDYAPVVPKYPTPVLALAVEAASKGDDVKLGNSLQRLVEEDPTLTAGQDRETRDFVVSGMGELQLRVALEKLKNRFNVTVTTRPPKVAYRETITAKAEGHHRLKKQTGGAGQFAEVFLRVEPLKRGDGFEFVNETFGGSIPHQFLSSVEKGAQDAMDAGILAGAPVQDVKVIVYDGKSHPVDSKDVAFRTAAKLAVRDAFSRARPVVLEPLCNMEITVPESHMGTVTGDLKSIRGRVVGIDSLPGGVTVVRAQAAMAEIGNYIGQLRGATGGEGSFVMELSHYEPVPPGIQEKLQANYKPHGEQD